MKKIAFIVAAVATLAASVANAGTIVTGKITSVSYSDQNPGYVTLKVTATSGTMAACATNGTYTYYTTQGDNSSGSLTSVGVLQPFTTELVLAGYTGAKTVAARGLGTCFNGSELLGSITLQ